MQAGVGVLVTDVMPIFMIIALDIIITLRFSINCSTVICLPTVCFLSRERPLVKTMALGSIFYHIIFRSTKPKTQKYLAEFFYFYFVLHFSNLLYLSLSDLILTSDHEGIDNPFITLGASCWLFVHVFGDLCVISYWIDTLVLKSWGKYLVYSASSPFPLQGKNQRKLKM